MRLTRVLTIAWLTASRAHIFPFDLAVRDQREHLGLPRRQSVGEGFRRRRLAPRIQHPAFAWDWLKDQRSAFPACLTVP